MSNEQKPEVPQIPFNEGFTQWTPKPVNENDNQSNQTQVPVNEGLIVNKTVE